VFLPCHEQVGIHGAVWSAARVLGGSRGALVVPWRQRCGWVYEVLQGCFVGVWEGGVDGETVLGMGERRLAHHQGSTQRGGKQSPHRLYRS
jgi:hypothetical protein